MPWITPTPAQCKARLRKEWAIVARGVKAEGEDEDAVVQRVIDQQVARVVGRVPAHIARGEVGTIPDEMLSCFLALWVHEFLTSLPGLEGLLDARRVSAYENALKELDALSLKRIQIAAPVDPAPAEQQAAGPGVAVARQPVVVQDMRTAGLL